MGIQVLLLYSIKCCSLSKHNSTTNTKRNFYSIKLNSNI